MPEKMYTKNSTSILLWILTGFIFGLLFPLTFLFLKLNSSYFKPLLFLVCCLLFYFSTYKEKRFEKPIKNIILGILIFLVCYFFYTLALTFFRIPQWDFLSFYLFGKVGLSSQNFYDPHVFMKFYNSLNLQSRVDVGFIPEIVNVGFWYPPPSMFLFLPLGLFNVATAYMIWQSIVVLFLIADVFLLIKYFPVSVHKMYDKKVTLYFSIIIILLFPSLTSAITYSQTISIFLFFLILLIRHRDNRKAGVLLVFLVLIKPLAAILLLYFIIYKKWKIIQVFFLTGLIILGVSLIYFGYNSFVNYFISPPTSRIPSGLFYESTIESLNGVLLRLQLKIWGSVNFKIGKTLTFVFTIPVILITIFSSKNLSPKGSIFSFLIFLPMMLLIYPNTQDFYIPILLPVTLYLLINKRFQHNIFNLALIFFLYIIGYYSLFMLSVALWIAFFLWSLADRYSIRFSRYSFNKIIIQRLGITEKKFFNC